MAVRRFNANNGEFITCAAGNLVGINEGAFTVAVLAKKQADGDFFPTCSAEQGGSGRRGLWTTNADAIAGVFQGQLVSGPVTFTQSDGWAVIAISKPAGEATIRVHKKPLGGGSWSHADGDTADDDAFNTIDNIKLGSWQDNTHWHGLIAVVGMWKRQLSDGELEDGLDTALAAWLEAEPDGLWGLNQASTATALVDLTGGGADQTAIDGTGVVTDDDPPGFSFSLGGEERELEGTAQAAAAAHGSLRVVRGFAAAAGAAGAAAGTVAAARGFAGAAPAAATGGGGAAAVARGLAGGVDAAAAAAAQVTLTVGLAGATQAAAAAAGAAAVGRPLAATIEAAAAASGTAAATRPYAGAASAAAAAEGTLATAGQADLAGAAAAVSAAAGSLTVQRPLATAATAAAAGTGQAGVARPLAAAAGAVADTTAAAAVARGLAAAAASAASASGGAAEVDRGLAGAAAGAATAAGGVAADRPLTGTAQAAAAGSAALTLAEPTVVELAGMATAAAHATGTLTVTRPTWIPGRLTATTVRPLLIATTVAGELPPRINVLSNPSLWGWPSAATTGYTGSLQPTAGGIDYGTPGGTIEDLDIDGVAAGYGLFVNADGVTIRNCRIRTTPGVGGGAIVVAPGRSDVVIEHCEISYVAPGTYASAIVMGESQVTVRYCHIHHVSEGPRIGPGCVIEHCYIHTMLVDDPDAHADAVQCTGASGFRIHHNTIVADQAGADFANAALILGSEFAESNNFEVTDNLLDGGGFTFFLGPSENFGMSNVLVRGNRFGPNSAFGPISIGDGIQNLRWEDNVLDATNEPVLVS